MRAAFWALFLVGMGCVAGGLLLQPPLHGDIPTSIIGAWYLDQAVWVALVAAGVGGGIAWWTHRLRNIPHEDSRSFHARVAGRGLVGYFVAAGVVLLPALARAAVAEELPLSRMQRVVLLFGSGKIVLLVGTLICAAGLLYAVVTRARRWGGQYSLLSENWIPKV